MKKLIALFLILVLALPAVGIAEYVPGLNMTMKEFIGKYNAVQAPLGAPYIPLGDPIRWTTYEGQKVAWFYPQNGVSVSILLLSKDQSASKTTEIGLDNIQIYIQNAKDFIPFISVTDRCASLFALDVFGVSVGTYSIASAIKFYYENNLKDRGLSSYQIIDEDQKYALSFFNTDGYYFSISAAEDAI